MRRRQFPVRLAVIPDGSGSVPRKLLPDYRSLAQDNSFYDRFVAVTLLNLGRLRGDLGDVRQAKEDTKAALEAFRRVDSMDHHHSFANEVQLAKAQLSRLRWGS